MKKGFPGVVFVDVDNLYIINNHVNVKVLKARVERIKQLNCRTYWFGNDYTDKIVRKYKVDIDMINSKIETNSADHNLINYMLKTKNPNALVITGDNTLCKLAAFINEDKKVRFAKFVSNDLVPVDVDYNFKTREHLLKFVQSLALYLNRF